MSNGPLYLARMTLDPAAIVRFAAHNGLARAPDDDLGYALHAWLAAMFSAHAPRPFRLMAAPRAAPLTLMAYSDAPDSVLVQQAQAFGDPLAHAVLLPDSLATKAMPSHWDTGTRLVIDVLACPVRRRGQVEKDAYLHALQQDPHPVPTRREVYAAWMREQIAGAAELTNVRLTGFSRTRLARRGHANGASPRLFQALERPCATLTMLATIRDGAAFGALLGRGVGRHRAFGFGMLLLRPPT